MALLSIALRTAWSQLTVLRAAGLPSARRRFAGFPQDVLHTSPAREGARSNPEELSLCISSAWGIRTHERKDQAEHPALVGHGPPWMNAHAVGVLIRPPPCRLIPPSLSSVICVLLLMPD